MNHPLTDEIAENVAPMAQWAGDIGDTVFRHCDMRAAADWQLKQVVEWMKDGGYATDLLLDLKAAMRPQEDD